MNRSRWIRWLGSAFAIFYVAAVMIYLLLLGALSGNPVRFYWGLVGVGVVSVGAVVFTILILRRMDRMEESHQDEMQELRRRLDQIEHGQGLSYRTHRILCMRLAGFTYREINANLHEVGMSTIEREVSYLKDLGLLE
jgi:hypothetical protein